MKLVCPRCKGQLIEGEEKFSCPACNISYPIENGIADFAQGHYFDTFNPSDALSPSHLEGLELEVEGSIRRITDFYGPLIRKLAPSARRVLDCGCGNGLSVDRLNDHGYEGWGNDVSQLRKWQWRERKFKQRLVVASGSSLPFPDGYFDVVIISGVIEHIGVEENAIPRYSVRLRSDRDEQRMAFLRELKRVTVPEGLIFLDFPNGAFPIDFWHGGSPGSPRFHSTREGFLPTFAELHSLIGMAMPGAIVTALSPRGRLRFRQASRHWYGRALRFPVALFFRAMNERIARSAINPFLVVSVSNLTAPLSKSDDNGTCSGESRLL